MHFNRAEKPRLKTWLKDLHGSNNFSWFHLNLIMKTRLLLEKSSLKGIHVYVVIYVGLFFSSMLFMSYLVSMKTENCVGSKSSQLRFIIHEQKATPSYELNTSNIEKNEFFINFSHFLLSFQSCITLQLKRWRQRRKIAHQKWGLPCWEIWMWENLVSLASNMNTQRVKPSE